MPLLTSFRRGIRRNWQIIIVSVILFVATVSLGVFFFLRGSSLMASQLKDKLRTTAAMAAMQFDPSVIDHLQGPSAIKAPQFKGVVERLRAIRVEIPTIRFAYIMRRTNNPVLLEFVADADSLATPQELDYNHNGVVDENEKASYPGDTYDISDVPALQADAFQGPAVDQDFTTDQWGTLLSGYAPIRNAKGETIAVLGLDMDAGEYLTLSRSIFSPVAFLLLCIIGGALTALIAGFLWHRQIETLRRIDRERSGLLLLAMHQIGSPLTILRWSLEELTDKTGRGSAEAAIEEHAKNMQRVSTQLGSILDELREASDIDTGTITYTKELVLMKDVVSAVVDGLRSEFEARKQKIVVTVDPTLQLSLDRNLIGGVIRELALNAITFSPDGADIEIVAKHGGKCLLVDVRDHGCGISKTDLPRVFDKFTRGARAHLYQPNGNGLGLYIAKGIIERAHGDIWIETREGKGTTVSFTLPC